MNNWKVIGLASGASIAVSLTILLIGVCVLGFHLATWSETQGRLLGLAGTIGGIGGAVIGLRLALRTRRARS